MNSFYESLDELYPGQLERERVVTYGEASILRLIGFENRQYIVKQTLTDGDWMAWPRGRDQENQEFWSLEIASSTGVKLDVLRSTVSVDIVAGDRVNRFKILKNNSPIDVGLVYHLTIQPTGEAVAV